MKCLFANLIRLEIENTLDSFHTNAFRIIDNTTDEVPNIAMNEEQSSAEIVTSDRNADSAETVAPAESIEDISDEQSSNADVAEVANTRPQEQSSGAADSNNDEGNTSSASGSTAQIDGIQVPEGIDPSFLAALPEEMRHEVIAEHLRYVCIIQI